MSKIAGGRHSRKDSYRSFGQPKLTHFYIVFLQLTDNQVVVNKLFYFTQINAPKQWKNYKS